MYPNQAMIFYFIVSGPQSVETTTAPLWTGLFWASHYKHTYQSINKSIVGLACVADFWLAEMYTQQHKACVARSGYSAILIGDKALHHKNSFPTNKDMCTQI